MWELYIIIPFAILWTIAATLFLIKTIGEYKIRKSPPNKTKINKKAKAINDQAGIDVSILAGNSRAKIPLPQHIISPPKMVPPLEKSPILLLSERDYYKILEYVYGDTVIAPSEALVKAAEKYKNNSIKNKLKQV